MSALDSNEMPSLRELCDAHDALMREAAASKVIRKVHAPEPAPERPPAQPTIAGALTDDVLDGLAGGCLLIARDVARKERKRVERAMAPLRTEIAELRGQVSALLAVSGRDASDSAKIVDLPRVGWHRKA